jgi:queuosine precursor transporter
MPDKKSNLYLLLSVFFVGNAFLAELTGAKIFSIGALLAPLLSHGTNPPLWLSSVNMSIGVLIWPLVFITSDIMNEYFGRDGVRKISFLTAILISYALLFLLLANALPPAGFWLENNQTSPDGNPFNINYAFQKVLGQGVNIILGSITAFLVSQLVDAYTFQFLKKVSQHRYLWLRATGSTVISQVIDSFLIIYVAFYLLGNWSLTQVIQVAALQYAYKVGLAVILTPAIYGMHWVIDRYLGKSVSAVNQV